jgi:hypothetical protein
LNLKEWSSLGNQESEFRPSRDEKDRLAIHLLDELGQRTLDAIVDLVGVNSAIEMLNPAARFCGASVNHWIIEHFGLGGSDLEKICSVMQESNQLMGKELRPYELTSSGARCEVLACPFSNAKPEFCELFCAVAGIGMCHNINPRYNFVIPSRMSLGAESCRWVIIDSSAKSDPQSEDVVSIISWKQFDRMIQDQSDLGMSKSRYWIGALAAFWIQEVTTLIATYGGERTTEILSPYLRALGFSFGMQIREELKLENNDAVAIGSVLDILNECLSQNGVLKQADSQLVVKEIKECPAFAGALPEMCILFERLTNGICEAINPDFEVTHKKAICRGDSSCIRIIRKKGVQEKPREKEEIAPDSPINVLTLMYVKGEITKDEYEEKMAVIKKHYPRWVGTP